ncbi:hypothetical protein DAEQUDRAFT_767686 [Daedalea quercina L-15889]|uniref:PB1 domain-containing protein n=1 Tax=Daedalea quercina L-15889 TaxID=1314783 RepID=A0A165NE94_9APHY|nr:hypothetical protein DAEQUDRAFT_767686 [Daedalea quercina L-15889]
MPSPARTMMKASKRIIPIVKDLLPRGIPTLRTPSKLNMLMPSECPSPLGLFCSYDTLVSRTNTGLAGAAVSAVACHGIRPTEDPGSEDTSYSFSAPSSSVRIRNRPVPSYTPLQPSDSNIPFPPEEVHPQAALSPVLTTPLRPNTLLSSSTVAPTDPHAGDDAPGWALNADNPTPLTNGLERASRDTDPGAQSTAPLSAHTTTTLLVPPLETGQVHTAVSADSVPTSATAFPEQAFGSWHCNVDQISPALQPQTMFAPASQDPSTKNVTQVDGLKIRLKLHYQGTVRGTLLASDLSWDAFEAAIIAKLGLPRAGIQMEFEDTEENNEKASRMPLPSTYHCYHCYHTGFVASHRT